MRRSSFSILGSIARLWRKIWRRDPNETRIQPYSEDTGERSGKPKHQSVKAPTTTYRLVRLVGEVSLLALVVIIPLSVQAGFFGFLFTSPKLEDATTAPVISPSAIDIELLAASSNPNPLAARGGAEIVVDDNALISTGPVGKDEITKAAGVSTGEIRVYTVRPGDSLSQIASMFGVTTNTIMWANDITKASAIQPGDTLVILPIVGVRHVVKKGDTIASIAKKYEGDADEIMSYNQIPSASEIIVGDTLIIPGGEMHMEALIKKAQPTKTSGSKSTGSGWLSHPAPGAIKTQGIHGYNAVDLAAGYGSPIRAAAAGEVIVSKSSGWNGGYGQYIVIRHQNGTQTLYAHLMRNDVGVGAYVSQGQEIGGMGSTGKSTGNHLHFEVRGGANPF